METLHAFERHTVSLSGTLDELGLPDVLQLIARSERTGSLRVSRNGLNGHVFFRDGMLAYATTRSEDSFVGDLIRMGLVDEDQRSDLERRRVDLSDVLQARSDRQELAEFLQEQIKEVLARLLRLEGGHFEFRDGIEPRYETGEVFPVGRLLDEAKARLAQWREIEEAIPSPAAPLRMALSLPDGHQEVTLDELSWSLLACLDGQAGVQAVARRLGMWEFPTAKTAARLVREGLVEVGETSGRREPAPRVEDPAVDEEPTEEPELLESEERETPAETGEPEKAEEVPEEPEEESPSELMRRWKELRSQR